MTTTPQNTDTYAASMQLTIEEKKNMRATLKAHMRKHPLPHAPSAVSSPFSILWSRHSIYIGAIAALILCGGTAYAAQHALPGGTLYPIRTHINERVELAFARTPADKAQVQFEFALRRVADAQSLARTGKLDAHMSKALQEHFNQYAADAIALAKLEAQGDMHATNLQASLAIQETIFRNINSTLGFEITTSSGAIAVDTDEIDKEPKNKKPSEIKGKPNTVYTATSPALIKIAPTEPSSAVTATTSASSTATITTDDISATTSPSATTLPSITSDASSTLNIEHTLEPPIDL